MSRIRYIKPGFFHDEDLADCSPLARILFAGLWTIADRSGRLEDRPRRIRAEVLPYDDGNTNALLQELADHGSLIIRYEVDGKRYIAIPGWEKHQKPHSRELPSIIPEPTEHDLGSAQAVPRQCPGTNKAGQSTTQAMTSPASGARVTGMGNGDGDREKEPPLPPKAVDKSKSGDDLPKTEEHALASDTATTCNLEALRHNAQCEDGECQVRTLRIGQRGILSKIVGEGNVGQMYAESTPLHKSLAGMAGYICAAAWKASAAATMEQRQPLCRKAMAAYVDQLYDFHRQKPIRSLPAFLKTRYGHLTEAPVPDELLAELRALERADDKRRKSEPRRVGTTLAPEFAGAMVKREPAEEAS